MSGPLASIEDVKNIVRVSTLFDDQVRACIDIADVLVQEEIAARDPSISHNRLLIIEQYLAAHFVSLSADETRVKENRFGGERGVGVLYTDVTGMGFNATRFGQTAMALDPTKNLANLDSAKGKVYFKAINITRCYSDGR